MEKETADALEMAAQANEERAKIKETAQGWINIEFLLQIHFYIIFNLFPS